MTIELVLRFIGGIVAATVTLQATVRVIEPGATTAFEQWVTYVLGSATFGVAFLVTPYITTRPFFALRQRLYQLTATEVVAVGAGLVLGLLAGALSAVPLSSLPGLLGNVLPLAASALFVYFGVVTLWIHRQEVLGLPGLRRLSLAEGAHADVRPVLLDTSAIIDGRVADVSRVGFLRAPVVVPRFVLEELQHIADSPDPLRRNRGRRGLEVLARLQKESAMPVEISDAEVSTAFSVDTKLVRLARTLSCPIVTSDYNLERVAQLQGVEVLNLNELANAVKPVVLPGEELIVQIVQEGKEPGQGLAFLDDGTMVVVEEGRRHLNETVNVVVARLLQTGTGRVIFAQVKVPSDGSQE